MVAFIPSRKIRMSCIRMTLVFRIRWLSIAASGGQANAETNTISVDFGKWKFVSMLSIT